MKTVYLPAIIIALFMLNGCTHNYTWKEYGVGARAISLKVDNNQEVRIIKGDSSKTKKMLGNIGMHKYYGNEQMLTDGIVTQLAKELRKRGANVTSPAAKSMEVTVNSTRFEMGMWRIAATLNYTVKFGNGKIKSYKTRNSSPSSVPRTYNGAVCRAVLEIVNDPEVQAYINDSSD